MNRNSIESIIAVLKEPGNYSLETVSVALAGLVAYFSLKGNDYMPAAFPSR